MRVKTPCLETVLAFENNEETCSLNSPQEGQASGVCAMCEGFP
jgi:hypothetical protein